MKQIRELERAILDLLMKIRNDFPELSKYLAEMPQADAGTDTAAVGVNSLSNYYNSLEELLAEYTKSRDAVAPQQQADAADFPAYPGYPAYPPSEDIYIQGKKEGALNPEDLSKTKAPNEAPGSPNDKGFKNHMSGADLDVPGSELDDQQENIGSEDEENNYYSLGGDDHHDLEEPKG